MSSREVKATVRVAAGVCVALVALLTPRVFLAQTTVLPLEHSGDERVRPSPPIDADGHPQSAYGARSTSMRG